MFLAHMGQISLWLYENDLGELCSRDAMMMIKSHFTEIDVYGFFNCFYIYVE